MLKKSKQLDCAGGQPKKKHDTKRFTHNEVNFDLTYELDQI